MIHFVYTVWCMFFLLRFRLLCHVCILACACELCIWCYLGMTISFSNICYHNICCAVRLFQSGYVQVNTSSIIFSINHLTHFHSSYMCESTLWDSTHTHSKGVSVTLQLHMLLHLLLHILLHLLLHAYYCIYYYATAYNTPETQNYDCVSYDIRSNPK